jgi:hypothetical protein
MKLALKIMLIYFLMLTHAYAAEKVYKDLLHRPYVEVRAALISQGWQPVNNNKIVDSSLYAQEIASKGYAEVLNCISMERDQCEFLFKRNKRYIIVTTKEKVLKVESVKHKKK